MIELRYIKRKVEIDKFYQPNVVKVLVLQYRNGTPIETHPEARTTRIEYIWTDWKDVPVVEEE